jgi:hypothetical protein
VKHWVFNLMSGLSLLLCLVCLGDVIWRGGPDAIIVLKLPSHWDVSWHWYDMTGLSGGKGTRTYWFVGEPGWYGDGVWGSEMVVLVRRLSNGVQRGWWVFVDYWTIIVLTAILPACSLRGRWRRSSRRQRGLCPTCGYDLRASKDRCPECGTPIANARKATAN